MDAVKFIKERNRMCKSFGDECAGCPANDINYRCKFSISVGAEAAKQVELLEEWSAAHPRKTRQSVFLEQWPTAKIDKSGYLDVCPYLVSSTHRDQNGFCKGAAVKNCYDCRHKFWMQEVE